MQKRSHAEENVGWACFGVGSCSTYLSKRTSNGRHLRSPEGLYPLLAKPVIMYAIRE